MPLFQRDSTRKTDINSLVSHMVDARRDGFYDRMRLPAGVPTPREIVFFQQGIGALKSWADTNMPGDGRFNAPYDVIARRFLMLFQPGGSRADELSLLRNYTWELWALQKCLQRHLLLEFSVKGNVAGIIRDFGSEDCRGMLERFAVPYAYDLCDLARHIPPLLPFKVVLIGEPFIPQHDMDFYAILDGTADWPV